MKTIKGTVMTINNAVECPDKQKIANAIKVLGDQRVSIYQELYANGLASPGNHGPFALSRKQTVVGEGFHIEIKHVVSGFSFTSMFPEGVVDKANQIMEAVKSGKKKVHSKACCPLAEINPCVCEISFKCPIHGGSCHGSHD